MPMNNISTMISLNVNQFCGSKSWSSNVSINDKKQCCDSIFEYIFDKIQSSNDIAYLYELPYNDIILMDYLKAKLLKKKYRIIYPQKLDEFCTLFNYSPCEATLGITTDDSNWNYDSEEIYPYSEYISYVNHVKITSKIYCNRILDLYNKELNIHALGVHIPDATYKPDASVMWADIKYYYSYLYRKCVYIMGDFNVYSPNTIQSRKFHELKDLGAKDLWTENRNSPKTPTFNGNTRVDYILSSPPAMIYVDTININDSDIRSKNLSDHSSIELYLSL